MNEDLIELRTMRASWQALARAWGLGAGDLRELLPDGGEDVPMPPGATETRMRLMLAVGHRLPFRDDEDEMFAWVRRVVPELGGLTPLEVMAEGNAHMRELRLWAEWKYRS